MRVAKKEPDRVSFQMLYLMVHSKKSFVAKVLLIDLFLNSRPFKIAYDISLVKDQTNYFKNSQLILDVKQLNKIMKFYYVHALKAL